MVTPADVERAEQVGRELREQFLYSEQRVRTQKECSKCGETKPMDEFHRDNRLKSRHKAECKLCIRIRIGRA